jgi:ligand-binding sensor domain-containing protein
MLGSNLRGSTLALIIIFVITGFQAKSQTYYFDKYEVREGLAQSKVYCTFQDKDGFVWLGTTIGVSKFDGSTFQNFYSDNGLAENGVKCIMKDSRGVMWLGHIGGGITRYDGSDFKKVMLKVITHDITSIVEDEKGKVWFSTVGDGAVVIENPIEKDTKKLIYKQYRGKETISDFVFSIYKRKDNTLFFITDLGLKTYNQAKKAFEFFKSPVCTKI